MYFGFNSELNKYSRLDIDGEKDIVCLNRQEMDNKSRKNIGAYLRDRTSKQGYRFSDCMSANSDEVLKAVLAKDIDFDNVDSLYIGDIEFKRKRFKNVYRNVKIFLIIKNGECKHFLMEGYRYLSLEEACHAVDLIDNLGSIMFSVDKDIWVEIQKS